MQTRVEGLDTAIEADQLVATLNRGADTRNPAVIAKMMSTGTQKQRVWVRPGPACSYDGAAIARYHLNC